MIRSPLIPGLVLIGLLSRAACGLSAPQAPQTGAPAQPETDQRLLDSRDHVRVSVKTDRARVPQGADLPVAIVLDHEDGWHIWTNEQAQPDDVAVFDFAVYTNIVNW